MEGENLPLVPRNGRSDPFRNPVTISYALTLPWSVVGGRWSVVGGRRWEPVVAVAVFAFE